MLKVALSFQLDISIWESLRTCNIDMENLKESVFSLFRKEASGIPKDNQGNLQITKEVALSIASFMADSTEELVLDVSNCESYEEFDRRYGFIPTINVFVFCLKNDKEHDFDIHYILIAEEIGKVTENNDVVPVLYQDSGNFH